MHSFANRLWYPEPIYFLVAISYSVLVYILPWFSSPSLHGVLCAQNTKFSIVLSVLVVNFHHFVSLVKWIWFFFLSPRYMLSKILFFLFHQSHLAAIVSTNEIICPSWQSGDHYRHKLSAALALHPSPAPMASCNPVRVANRALHLTQGWPVD
jgi:hypothetical protein